MKHLADNNIVKHIRESSNNVTRVDLESIFSYKQQMVIHYFDKIIQGLLDVDPSCTFPLYHYFNFDIYIYKLYIM